MKTCKQCSFTWFVEGFPPAGRLCWECKRAYDRENAKRHYWRNAEAMRERARAFWRDKPEQARANLAASQARHRERRAEDTRQYKAANRQRCTDRENARRAQKLAQYVEHVDRLVVLERDDGVCGICSLDVDPLSFHVDHVVPLARGGEHSYANTQIAHPVCNVCKGHNILT
jgi:5-methylcytosine-specific restriction endonuclease McrA